MSPAVRRRLAGVVFLLVPALLIWLAVAVYDKQFTDDAEITVHTSQAGNEMHVNADVKLRGVVVGQVRGISSDGRGARLRVALKRDKLADIPADVRAQMLPTTVFGQRYVALVPPRHPSPRPLRAGATIPQDRSRNAIELEQVLDNLLPTLTAVQPQKLSATLTAVARALEGRGGKLGDTLVTLDSYLAKLNPHLPALNRDIRELVQVSHLYADTAPDILGALSDFATTSSTLVEKAGDLSTAYGAATGTAREVTTFLRENRGNIIRLAHASRPTLRTLAAQSAAFPCTLRTLATFVPVMDEALGKGTDEPGLHVNLKVVRSRGKYVAGKDTPAPYTGGAGPRCYSVPYLGPAGGTPAADTGKAGSDPAPEGATIADARGGTGMPNSPQENRLINELLAPDGGQLPGWSSVLVGPALRGTEVRLK
ncbi:MCE family protein [Streptomyces albus]|uniref:MCE family protein n=1 Tax=Streptomyces albus TaxID=1888 RepID=UPI0024AC884C|nr:MCE family protein [Streptomyces albus]MDI6409060.1 MCE family protein [Streptomyces albus]